MTQEDEDNMMFTWAVKWVALIIAASACFVPIIFILDVCGIFNTKTQIILTIVYVIVLILLAFIQWKITEKDFEEMIERRDRWKITQDDTCNAQRLYIEYLNRKENGETVVSQEGE